MVTSNSATMKIVLQMEGDDSTKMIAFHDELPNPLEKQREIWEVIKNMSGPMTEAAGYTREGYKYNYINPTTNQK